ncbi:16S rRNA (cytosine(1402)-N(4))-methyltransferase RsmH [Candidatus Endowatersipora endosymbiont of Watersipora subatra]|uniref:16S rRNA (cytosine(1402)-N(4))-methyltransferase RsmH n=1 Tax=Candidatus Endowatersipora endosymbiont of Watersipora subatra TaxID=3077946 RepID=UPI00312CA16D
MRNVHIPVMLSDVLNVLDIKRGQILIDATFGAGGYSHAFLKRQAKVLGIDRDPDAVAAAKVLVNQFPGQVTVKQARFSQIDFIARLLGYSQVDAVIADVGVSSMQIDRPERGFSFQTNGPLDMRMEKAGISAADVINTMDHPNLTRIIRMLGDEKRASQVSKKIIQDRQIRPFETTIDLTKCVEGILGRTQSCKIHPATRTFQALRIFVNAELDQLFNALLAAERILKPGGLLVVVTFHSLEDRLVKKFMLNRSETHQPSRYVPQIAFKAPTFRLEYRSPIFPSSQEIQTNSRARSAKLRYAFRTESPARIEKNLDFRLPQLQLLSSVLGEQSE